MLSRNALLIIVAVAIGAVAVGVVVTWSTPEGNATKGRQLSIDLNENLALKGNP